MKTVRYRDLPAANYFWRRGGEARWYNAEPGIVFRLEPWGQCQPPPADDEEVLTDPIVCTACWNDTREMTTCPVCGHVDPERESVEVALEVLSRWTGRTIVFY